MQNIFGEFILQVIKVVFYIAIIVVAVKLGIYMAKNKKAKAASEEKNQ